MRWDAARSGSNLLHVVNQWQVSRMSQPVDGQYLGELRRVHGEHLRGRSSSDDSYRHFASLGKSPMTSFRSNSGKCGDETRQAIESWGTDTSKSLGGFQTRKSE